MSAQTYYRALVAIDLKDGAGYLGFAGVAETTEAAESLGNQEEATMRSRFEKCGLPVLKTTVRVEPFQMNTHNKEADHAHV